MLGNGISDQIATKDTYFWHSNLTVMVVLFAALLIIFCKIKLNGNSVISYIEFSHWEIFRIF